MTVHNIVSFSLGFASATVLVSFYGHAALGEIRNLLSDISDAIKRGAGKL